MANRSLFPSEVEVHARHLQNESTQRVSQADQLAIDSTSLGVASGLVVSVNSPDTTRIAVSAGYGYAPNGEKLTLGTNVNNLALANTSLSALNYVLLVYDETGSSPEAHESDGTTRNTVATVTPRVTVLSSTAYAALPATDPVLSNNAVDRSMLLAIVTGAGVSVPLTGASIQGPTTFQTVLKITQPVITTGISVNVVDPLTNTGTGTLTFTASSKNIQWTAPGDSIGTAVTLTGTGIYNVFSNNGRYLNIQAEFPLLPVGNTTESLAIENLYTQVVTRLTNDDLLHRSLIGSGTPTIKNPHGMTLQDIDPGIISTVTVHQEQMHANGIAPGSASTLLAASVITATIPDQILINSFATGDGVYINGSEVQAIVGSSVVTFSDGIANQSLYGIYLSANGTLFKTLRASFPATGTTLLAGRVQIMGVSHGIGAATKNLVWNNSSQNLSFDGGAALDIVHAAPSTDQEMRLFSADNVNYVDVLVKGAASSGSSTQTDAITFSAQPDLEQNFHIVDVVWSGSATGFLGAGFGSSSSPNSIVDRRLFGTFAPANLRSDFGYNDAWKSAVELTGDGVALQRSPVNPDERADQVQINIFGVTGSVATMYGGVVYVGGKRFAVPTTTLSVTNSTTNRVYIDSTGIYRTSTSTWQQISDAQLGAPFLKLFDLVVTGGGGLSSSTSYRQIIGALHDQPFGVVSLNEANTATIIATDAGTGDAPALVATGCGVDPAIIATGSATGSVGLHAIPGAGGVTAITTDGALDFSAGTNPAYNATGYQDLLHKALVPRAFGFITWSSSTPVLVTNSTQGVASISASAGQITFTFTSTPLNTPVIVASTLPGHVVGPASLTPGSTITVYNVLTSSAVDFASTGGAISFVAFFNTN